MRATRFVPKSGRTWVLPVGFGCGWRTSVRMVVLSIADGDDMEVDSWRICADRSSQRLAWNWTRTGPNAAKSWATATTLLSRTAYSFRGCVAPRARSPAAAPFLPLPTTASPAHVPKLPTPPHTPHTQRAPLLSPHPYFTHISLTPYPLHPLRPLHPHFPPSTRTHTSNCATTTLDPPRRPGRSIGCACSTSCACT